MPRNRYTNLDVTRPRAVTEIINTALGIYGAYPAVCLALTTLVVVPCNLVLALLTGGGSLVSSKTSAADELLLLAVSWIIVTPLVAALQTQLVVDLVERERPRLHEVITQALPATLKVIAAAIMSAIMIVLGFFCFFIPGIYIAVRLAVVGPTAAFERRDWPSTLRAAWNMAHGNLWRIIGVLALCWVAVEVFELLPTVAIASAGKTVQVIVEILLLVIAQTFQTLVTVLLYFDLRAREESSAAGTI